MLRFHRTPYTVKHNVAPRNYRSVQLFNISSNSDTILRSQLVRTPSIPIKNSYYNDFYSPSILDFDREKIKRELEVCSVALFGVLNKVLISSVPAS